MPEYRRVAVPGGCYFFTLVKERRQPILTHPDIRHALREAIEVVRLTQPFRIDAWVLLPDHLHAIWTLPADDADFSNRWRLMKRHVTHACGERYNRVDLITNRRAGKGQGTLWQQRFWEHLFATRQTSPGTSITCMAIRSSMVWSNGCRIGLGRHFIVG